MDGGERATDRGEIKAQFEKRGLVRKRTTKGKKNNIGKERRK